MTMTMINSSIEIAVTETAKATPGETSEKKQLSNSTHSTYSKSPIWYSAAQIHKVWYYDCSQVLRPQSNEVDPLRNWYQFTQLLPGLLAFFCELDTVSSPGMFACGLTLWTKTSLLWIDCKRVLWGYCTSPLKDECYCYLFDSFSGWMVSFLWMLCCPRLLF